MTARKTPQYIIVKIHFDTIQHMQNYIVVGQNVLDVKFVKSKNHMAALKKAKKGS